MALLGGCLVGIGVALLEEVCHWRWALRFQKLKLGLVAHCLLLLPEDQDVELSASIQHHICLHTTMLSDMITMD